MTLPGQVESATPSVPGFDSDSIIWIRKRWKI